jgi:hypothetical protein
MLLIRFLALARLSTSFTYTAPGGRHRCQHQHPTNTVCARRHPKTDPWRRSTGSACRPTTSCIYALDSAKDGDDPSFDQDAQEHQDFSLVARFLESFWKGITLPFPALRRISLHPDFTSKKKKLSVGLSLREGLIGLIIYLAMGVFSYHLVLEKWSIVDSLYFTCTCFSTVGYGDLCPTTPASKLFTCAFGLGGIAFLGAALAAVGGSLVQAEIKTAQKARDKSRRRLMQMFEGMPNTVSRFRSQSHKEQKTSLKKGQKSLLGGGLLEPRIASGSPKRLSWAPCPR